MLAEVVVSPKMKWLDSTFGRKAAPYSFSIVGLLPATLLLTMSINLVRMAVEGARIAQLVAGGLLDV